ncbi:DUF1501 domain-containing protein [Symmachiella dynata]|uniref:DUF1501 domain-containing protein n=1 Tax=Symmachiella dynata TaxID=2527995 RepID=UPI0030ED48AB
MRHKFMTDQASSCLSRRDALKIAAAGTLSFALPALDLRAATKRGPEREKSLITLWLAGGPSQLETWDPHPGTKVGGPTKALATMVPGLHIADLFPHTAEQIHELSVIRSLVSKEGDHERGAYFLKTGYRPDPTVTHPSIAALVTQQQTDARVEIPRNVLIGNDPFPGRGGYLGDKFDPFKVFNPQDKVSNVSANVDDQRQQRRLSNLDIIEQSFRKNRTAAADRTQHRQTLKRALTMMTSEQLRAFELQHEPAAIRAAYGETSFGQGCLMARRLVETGVKAVQVTLDGFDTHANNFDGHQENAAILDPALAMLLTDLRQRDLLESTVVLCIGEFGRTPNINALDGRDHWPTGFSALLGGGGLRSGVVIGETDPTGAKKDPVDPIEVPDLYATILAVLGVEYAQEVITPIGRPLALCEGAPIERLLLPST